MIIPELKTVPIQSERKAGRQAFSKLRTPATRREPIKNAYFLLSLELWIPMMMKSQSDDVPP